MKIKTFNAYANCYLVSNGNECIIIDPCVKYEEVMKDVNLKLVGVFITHGHFDHVLEISSYLDKGLKFYMHKNAYEKLSDPLKNCSNYFYKKLSFAIDSNEVVFVDENSKINLMNKDIKILETPGHTDCSICIIIDNMMFSGDMLFAGTVGRYDLYTSNYEDLLASINKLKNLSWDYIVYPGHGQQTTLQTEINTNMFFKGE